MTYVVIYRTATHVAHVMYDSELSARQDSHMGPEWMGRLYCLDDAAGFGNAEAKKLYKDGVDGLAPGWGARKIEVE